VKGKGAGLDDPSTLPWTPPVAVRLVNVDTLACFGTTFEAGDLKRSSELLFKGKDVLTPQ